MALTKRELRMLRIIGRQRRVMAALQARHDADDADDDDDDDDETDPASRRSLEEINAGFARLLRLGSATSI